MSRALFLNGVLFALASALFPALSQTFSKVLSVQYAPFVIVFFRSIVTLGCISGWAVATGNTHIYKTRNLRANIIRGVIGTISVSIIFWAFALLPVGDVAAITNTSPLISVLLASVFLKEHIGWKRGLILCVGFSGILLMAQPSGNIPLKGFLVALSSACSVAIVTVLIRHLGKSESPVTMTFYFSLVGTVMTGVTLPFVWNGWDPHLTWIVLLMAGFGMLAQLANAYALKILPVAVKEPIGYTFFLWVVLFGYLIWDKVPAPVVLIGSAIVITSNLLLVFLEYRKNKRVCSDAELQIS